ncbi:LysR substrate-binding domain-containing protein [Aeromicrobium tamlense]|uniref:DNA-binding transcriptional LysR family regulator n=1 Tax=Aeromicrobium tamlense TaxID=375541 RepID=A0ABX2SJ15_9ACTN|nr:DNA-binding transcriptional LysR family regulator [Aeromicrobium tamlense]
MLDTLDEGVVRVAESKTPSVRRVGTFRTAGALLLAPAISRLRREGRLRSEIELVHGPLREHLVNVKQGASDCAIVYSFEPLRTDAEDGLEIRTLALDPYQLWVHRDHPAARKQTTIDLRSLAGDHWIGRQRAGEADDSALEALGRRYGFTPRVNLREDDYAIVTAFLSSGGVALLPSLYQPAESSVVKLKTVQELGHRYISFVCCAGERDEGIGHIGDALADVLAAKIASKDLRAPG